MTWTPDMVLASLREKLPKNNIVWYDARWYVEFDKTTKNVQITPHVKLQDLLTKDYTGTATRIAIKLIAHLENIITEYGAGVEVIETSVKDDCETIFYDNKSREKTIRLGTALSIVPVSRDGIRDLQKVVRAVSRRYWDEHRGMLGYLLYPNRVFISSTYIAKKTYTAKRPEESVV